MIKTDLLVSEVDGHVGHEMSHGDGGVTITELLVGLNVVNEDNEVLVIGLVVDLGLGSLAASHLEARCCGKLLVRGW